MQHADDQAWRLPFDIVSETGAARVELALGRDAVAVDRQDKTAQADWRLVFEHRTGRRWFHDRAGRRHVECDLDAGGAARMLAAMPRARVKATGAARPLRAEGVAHTCRHLLFDVPGAVVEVWAVPLDDLSAATIQLAWAILTGHQLAPDDLHYGVPVEIIVRRVKDLAKAATRMEARAPQRMPASAIAADLRVEAVRGQRVEIPKAPRRRGHDIKTRAWETTRLLTATAGDSGPDVAWLPRQALLDRLRTIINKATPAFGTFRGNHNDSPALHLDPIDWWGLIYGRLTAQGMDTVDGLIGLALMLRAIDGERIDSMTDAQRAKYEEVLRQANEREGDARLIYLATTMLDADYYFTDAEWIALGYAETAADRAPLVFTPTGDDGGPLVTAEGTIADMSLAYKIDSMDLTVKMGSRANLDRLEFRDGGLSVGISLDEISLDFRFLTWPDPTFDDNRDALHVIGELGGVVAATVVGTNAGLGRLTIQNPTLTVDLRRADPPADPPAPDSPAPKPIALTASYNRDLSSMTATLDALGLNLAGDVVIGIGTRLTDKLATALGNGLGDKVKNAVEGLDLAAQWPDAWHTERGPGLAAAAAIRSALAFVDGGAGLTAWLAQPLGIRGVLTPPGALDATNAEFSGVALSQAYLAAWLRGRMTRRDLDPSLPLTLDVRALERALGVTLPRSDPKRKRGELPLAPPTPPRRTMVIAGQLADAKIQIDRTLFMEVLPTFRAGRSVNVALPDGPSPSAGTAELVYFVNIAVTKYVVKAQPVQFDDPRQFGGAHGDPVGGLDTGPSKRHPESGFSVTEAQETLVSYLDAQVRVRFPIVFGLKGFFAHPALPDLTLGVLAGTVLTVGFDSLAAADPLTDNAALRQFLEDAIRADAEQLVAPLRDNQLVPFAIKPLIPISSYTDGTLNERLKKAVTLRQVGAAPGDALVYNGKDGWVYWNWEWVDQLDSWFP